MLKEGTSFAIVAENYSEDKSNPSKVEVWDG